MRESQGTRDAESMKAWARAASTPTLRAVRAEAEREGDLELVGVIDLELLRR